MLKKMNWLFAVMAFAAAIPAQAATGAEILAKVDAAEFGPKDISLISTMVLVNKAGAKSSRKLETYQKGSNVRLVRFLEPADVRGMAFLDAGPGGMYVYLSAFKKSRKIAGHVKNKPFAGTDFSYEDLAPQPYASRFDVAKMTESKDAFILELVPKPSAASQYSKAIMTVRKADHMFSSLELYNGSGVKWKVLTRSDFRSVGKYVVPFVAVMEDIAAKHSTTSKVEVIRCDTGLADDIFSPRKLER
jgi:outer membrane lipoprotein-sorting protein